MAQAVEVIEAMDAVDVVDRLETVSLGDVGFSVGPPSDHQRFPPVEGEETAGVESWHIPVGACVLAAIVAGGRPPCQYSLPAARRVDSEAVPSDGGLLPITSCSRRLAAATNQGLHRCCIGLEIPAAGVDINSWVAVH